MPSKRDVRGVAEQVHLTGEELRKKAKEQRVAAEKLRRKAAGRVRAAWARIDRER
jgi:hypothetical protein